MEHRQGRGVGLAVAVLAGVGLEMAYPPVRFGHGNLEQYFFCPRHSGQPRTMELVTTESGWVLALKDCNITRLEIDFQFGLLLSDIPDTATLKIGFPFEFNNGSETIHLNPMFATAMGPALPLFNSAVLDVTIQKTGHLKLRLKDGRSIEVYPDEQYEAWQITSSLNFLMVCAPGGEIVLFV